MGSPVCDRLTVTVPRSHDAALRDVQEEFGVLVGAAPTKKPGVWLSSSGGTLFYVAKPGFALLEASGRVLSELRGAALLGDYLGVLGALPCRVTRLDACVDVPVRSAPILHDLWGRARAGGVKLGRKSVPGTQAAHFFTRALYEGEPLDTGTVWVPSRRLSRADRFATVYDKRQERLSKGFPDPGPLTRYEAVAGRGMGASLGDAYDPTGLFFEIMSPDVLPAPSDTPPWSPLEMTWHGGPHRALTPTQRLERLVDGPLGGALVASAQFPGGAAFLLRLLARRLGVGAADVCDAAQAESQTQAALSSLGASGSMH